MANTKQNFSLSPFTLNGFNEIPFEISSTIETFSAFVRDLRGRGRTCIEKLMNGINEQRFAEKRRIDENFSVPREL